MQATEWRSFPSALFYIPGIPLLFPLLPGSPKVAFDNASPAHNEWIHRGHTRIARAGRFVRKLPPPEPYLGSGAMR